MDFYDSMLEKNQNYIEKLAMEYPFTIARVSDLFALGGRKYTEVLCQAEMLGYSSMAKKALLEGLKSKDKKVY